MSRKRDRAVQEHWEALAAYGCWVCCQPAQMHHATGGSMKARGIHKGMGQKNSDWLVIPLCERHHTGVDGLHKIGVAQWEERFGPQAVMLDAITQATQTDVWHNARQERVK